MVEEVVRLYEAYLEEFHRQKMERKAFGGVFGLRGGPQDLPCHEKFMQDLGQMLQPLPSQAPDSREVEDILRFIYCTAPARWESELTVYWMLLAAHSLTPDLIGCLDANGARALYGEYEKQYPRRQRLPVQTQILNALKGRSEAK